jgi:hypothetical protein
VPDRYAAYENMDEYPIIAGGPYADEATPVTRPITPLSPPDEHGDTARVWAWDDDTGVEIDAPGCGTAVLNDKQAQVLMHWLMERYGMVAPW